MTPIVLYPARWKSALLAVLCVGAIALCVWLVREPDIQLSLVQTGAVWIVLAATPIAFVIYVRQLLWPRPAIEISTWGVRDYRTKIAAPWEAIRGVGEWIQQAGRAKVRWLFLDVADPGAAGAKTKGALASMNQALGAPPVLLYANGLPGAHGAVLAAIAKFQPNLPTPST